MVSVTKSSKALVAGLLAVVMIVATAPLASAGGPLNGYTAELVVTANPAAQVPGGQIDLVAAAGGCEPGTPFTVTDPGNNVVASGTVAPDGGWTASFTLNPALTEPTVINYFVSCGDTPPYVYTTTFGIAVLVNTFVDVPNNAYFTESVEWAAALGITTGVGGSDEFRPFDVVTRAQAVTFLWRLYGSPTGYPDPGFVDVPDNTWFTEAVYWAAAEGVTTGVGGTDRFEPFRTTSRYEYVTFIWRSAGSPLGPPEGGTWPVAPPSAQVPQGRWFSIAVNFAYATGITNGRQPTGAFFGTDPTTRADAVTFLQRFAAYDGNLGPASVGAGLVGAVNPLDTESGAPSVTNTIAILAVVALALGVGLQLLRPRRLELGRSKE